MIKLFSNKYTTHEVFSNEELDAIAASSNQVVLVEGCLCVLMLEPGRLAHVIGQIDGRRRADLLELLLKRVVLGYRHYSGAVRALLDLGARPDGDLVSDLAGWAIAKGPLELVAEFDDGTDLGNSTEIGTVGDSDVVRAFLRAALLHRHVDAVRALLPRLADVTYERSLAVKLGLDVF